MIEVGKVPLQKKDQKEELGREGLEYLLKLVCLRIL
jgi:hypothetical protein